MIEEFLKKPIPNLDSAREKKKDYRQFPIVPVEEEFMDLLDFGISGENYYQHFKLPNGGGVQGAIPNLYVRKTIVDKLIEINTELQSLGLELFVRDSYRPPLVQKFMHDVWAPMHLKEQHPDWTDEKILSEVNQYWAYVNDNGTWEVDPNSPPPHTTGAAIDLTMRDKKTKQIIEMGAKFDELEESVYPDFLEKIEKPTSAEIETRGNRRLLYWLMLSKGFVNNPTEWWHYSYGDQMWAKMSDASNAIYSNISLDKK